MWDSIFYFSLSFTEDVLVDGLTCFGVLTYGVPPFPFYILAFSY